MKLLFTLLTACGFTLLAADVTGNWKATREGPNGTMERTFTFKVDVNALTGETTSNMFGKSTITEGKVNGDDISFTITVRFQDNEMKLQYKGKVSGNEIRFKVEFGDQSFEITAKRL